MIGTGAIVIGLGLIFGWREELTIPQRLAALLLVVTIFVVQESCNRIARAIEYGANAQASAQLTRVAAASRKEICRQ